MRILSLYPEDFANLNDWYAICDQLGIPYDALFIDIECTRVAYNSQEETNILSYLN
jgi:hypothetical protein